MLAGLYCVSHWQLFDGGFHRPGNKFKKAKAREERAERNASARGSKHADEERERERRRSDASGARPSRAELRRGRSRDKIPKGSYSGGRGRRGDDRYDDSSDDESSYERASAPREQHRGKRDGHRVRVQQAPHGDYVYEDEILDDHPRKPSLRPVNARHARTAELKPADFAFDDPSQPGHRPLHETRYEEYSALYGARDTGHDFIDTA
jgi:hypothetical protein